MRDGLYLVDRHNIYAAFVVKGGKVTTCAPILRNNLGFYTKIAKFIGNGPTQQEEAHPDRAEAPEQERDEVPSAPSPEFEGQYPPVWRKSCA